tara:strand:+ start:54 stop:161 length:108 start_codon:yes stop_codon:yes gene_type:complete
MTKPEDAQDLSRPKGSHYNPLGLEGTWEGFPKEEA